MALRIAGSTDGSSSCSTRIAVMIGSIGIG
jgi:hypothetical protein